LAKLVERHKANQILGKHPLVETSFFFKNYTIQHSRSQHAHLLTHICTYINPTPMHLRMTEHPTDSQSLH
jgi:hypothetical protein